MSRALITPSQRSRRCRAQAPLELRGARLVGARRACIGDRHATWMASRVIECGRLGERVLESRLSTWWGVSVWPRTCRSASAWPVRGLHGPPQQSLCGSSLATRCRRGCHPCHSANARRHSAAGAGVEKEERMFILPYAALRTSGGTLTRTMNRAARRLRLRRARSSIPGLRSRSPCGLQSSASAVVAPAACGGPAVPAHYLAAGSFPHARRWAGADEVGVGAPRP